MTLPFPHEFGEDGRLYFLAGNQSYFTEVGAWGAHGAGHTGHPDGDGKSNFAVWIEPRGVGREYAGSEPGFRSDGDGVCEPREACGIPLENIEQWAPWYAFDQDRWHLSRIEHYEHPSTGAYVPGDSDKWVFHFVGEGAFGFLDHSGGPSPELEALLKERGFDEALEQADTNIDPPIPLEPGMRLARPQFMRRFSFEADNQTWWVVSGQTEWKIFKSDVPEPWFAYCYWRFFNEEDQQRMQRAIDVSVLEPHAFGNFDGRDERFMATAEAKLCASEALQASIYDRIASHGWNDGPMADPTGDSFTVYPVHRDTAAYAARATTDFLHPDSRFVFMRGFDLGGFDPNRHFFELRLGSETWKMRRLAAEVVDLRPEQDTVQGDHFVAVIRDGRDPMGNGGGPLGKFLPVRYRLESERVVVHWGELASTLEAAQLPPPLPSEGITCDGRPYFCYSHARG